jgi:long-chain acyl-CoA synthetase
VTGTSATKIHEDSLLVADLGLTSIDRLELVNFMEQEYRLDVEDSQIGPKTRVSDLRQIIMKREKLNKHDYFRFWTNGRLFRGLRMACDAVFQYPLVRCFVILKVRGIDELKKVSGPAFFVANHLSYLDQPSVMFALPVKIRYHSATAAWAEFFFGDYHGFNLIWRLFCYEYGTFFLNLFPLPQSKGFGGSLKFMGRLADSGVNILIFPEGERARDGKLHSFRLGLGVMVKELGIPVVPIKISGTDQVLPPKARFPKRGRVTVTFGEPLMFSNEEPADIVEKTRQAVEKL